MDYLPNIFIREHRFPLFNSFKRVVQEGTGPTVPENTLMRYDQEIYNFEDFSLVSPSQSQFLRVSERHIENPQDFHPFQQILLTMRLGEVAWVLLRSGYHQESSEPWSDLLYFLKIASFESSIPIAPHMQSFISESRIGPNDSLLKRIIAEGKGNLAQFNNLITYYYSIFKENGSEFEPFTGKSHILPRVIPFEMHPALYHALLTMKEGEECVVLASPEFFKSRFKENLWFSIQMLYITEPTNCCFPEKIEFISEEELAPGIIKRVLNQGEGEVITNATKMWIELEGWLEDSFQFQKFKEECINFTKGNKSYSISQNLILNTMRRGEISLLKCPPGTHSYLDQLENETLWLKYKLVDYLESFEDLIKFKDIGKKLEICKQIKESANRLFRSGIRVEARGLYNRINSTLVFKSGFLESLEDEALKSEIKAMKSSTLNNLALVYLKEAEELIEKDKDLFEKSLKKAIEFSTADIESNPNNIKSYFRRSKAYEIKEDYDKAKEDILTALNIEPKNSELHKQLNLINSKIKKQDSKERSIYKEVFKEENWVRESKIEEERFSKINEEYNLIEEKEQEKEIYDFLSKIGSSGFKSEGADNISLLMMNSQDQDDY